MSLAKDMVAFVAGATGYTGHEVVRALGERGVRSVAHVRPGSPSAVRVVPSLEASGAIVERCPWEREAIATALSRHAATHVFALLGTTGRRGREAARRGRPVESYETVDYELSLLLLRATEDFARAGAANHKPVFVYLSSMGVHEGVKNRYLNVRARLEAAVKESELPYVIARPSFISGPDRHESRPGERWAANVTDGALSVARLLGARGLSDRYRSMTGAEVAQAIVTLALDVRGHGVLAEADVLRRAVARGY